MARRGGLGRGLGSLIPTGPLPASPAQADPPADVPAAQDTTTGAVVAALETGAVDLDVDLDAGQRPAGGFAAVHGAYFAEIPIAAIRPNPKQPRQVFDEEALEELTSSIREFGVLQPIVVRPLGTDDVAADGISYELVMGERRLRAAADVGLTGISAIVRETDDAAMLRDALLENLHRAQLAGGGCGLPAASGGVRGHARGAGRADRPQSLAGQQHHPPA
jgi:ParB family chromosome partitioning protein